MFGRVLVANRGEIAVRILQTLRRLGIDSAAVYTDADREAPHVEMADVAEALGPARAYLDVELILAAARRVGADAIHPGYGFLSENASFARACTRAGFVFVGPPAEAIELMGDKVNAKRAVAASGVPTVPGLGGPGSDDRQLIAAAVEIGLPVLLKPSAGGGGKGMRLVTDVSELPVEISAARREAAGAFGDDTLLVERFIDRPRHVEMQVLADVHGNCVALGERECSLQRRYQKIVEEAPSPLLDPATQSAMAASAVAVARSCDYVGAGTVEFILSAHRPDEYFFMEMNTRLQVEYPVTEAVLGIDLVELQLRIAAGEHLPWSSQSELPKPSGHAIEARVYAEDPERGFLPSSGRILALDEPYRIEGIRVDSGIRPGSEVSATYDPMLAKVISWAPNRIVALRRLEHALAATTMLGVATNVGFLRRLLRHPAVQRGELDTGLVEREAAHLRRSDVPDDVLIAAAVLARCSDQVSAVEGDPWSALDGWRVAGPADWTVRWQLSGEEVEVRLRGAVAFAGEREIGPYRNWFAPDGSVALEHAGRLTAFSWARQGDEFWLGRAGDSWRMVRQRLALVAAGRAVGHAGNVTSPMPGTVLAVCVRPGDSVQAGQRLAVVEAMKMEHALTADRAGTVVEVLVTPGERVALDQPLLLVS